MSITLEEVERISKLARINFNDEEKIKLQKELSNILDYVDQIKQLKLADFEEQLDPEAVNLMRDDFAQEQTPPAQLLKLAPNLEDNFYKVKSVLD